MFKRHLEEQEAERSGFLISWLLPRKAQESLRVKSTPESARHWLGVENDHGTAPALASVGQHWAALCFSVGTP